MVIAKESAHRTELEKQGWSVPTVESVGGPFDKFQTDEQLERGYMNTGRYRGIHTEQVSSALNRNGEELINPNYREVYFKK